MRAVLYAGLLVASGYVLLCVLLYLAQDRLLYLPTPDLPRPGVRALRLGRGAASLKVWELHGAMQPALIYFGGNAEDVGANIPDFDAAFPERAVYLVNYRGYGGSRRRSSPPTPRRSTIHCARSMIRSPSSDAASAAASRSRSRPAVRSSGWFSSPRSTALPTSPPIISPGSRSAH